jgi:enoyl-CoA hydratase/carnithine racemase
MTEHVKTEIANGVMTLTLQRPDKKNALTGAMYDALSDALEKAETDASVRVILFQGDGDSFTAGNDLADFASLRAAIIPARARRIALSSISARRASLWSPPCKAMPSASAPPCCCIATSSISPTMPG